MEHCRSLLGISMGIRRVLEDADAIAPTDCKVLITGERGVGKNLLAGMIHRRSRRAHLPVVTINCAGLRETVHESLDLPGQGTVLLDEVGDLSMRMQSLLLRLVDDGGRQRVRSDRREAVNVRVVALTSRDLLQQVRRHEFSEDLYYRLNVVHLVIPPLRERRQDINVLFDHFLTELSQKHGVPACRVTPEAMNVLAHRDWPGNARELKTIAERVLFTVAGRAVTTADLPL